ncbi:MAG: phosphoribosylformylglycinamidine synthase subunit PurQ [Phycisphaerae bacterium]|jgi:phosphoribosylformylglycinamidine synthase|nr:phosphoribosylformylglycinamidine synthase subunit PurQ [Phycisphaerae bacterium]|tara:strand:+ start:1311 stop:2126 length:816 start_codon:yes stop_codon:yes gene_type:complete
MTRALIITAPGINCDLELAEAFTLAGAQPFSVHINKLMRNPSLIDSADLIGFPGGFSYGDAVAAGRIMANLMRATLYEALVEAIRRSVPIIAPCNGFQIAAQIGLLPGPTPGSDWLQTPPDPSVTLAQNTSARFIDKWVEFVVPSNTRCVWTKNLEMTPQTSCIPIAHGEGRFVPRDENVMQQLEESGQIACRYGANDNPNGSVGDVMGICDASGLVLGLMPHPERFLRWTQHPQWTRIETQQHETLGLQMFRNAVAHTNNNVSHCVEGAV